MKRKQVGDEVSLWFSENDTYDWATRPNKEWPCSTLKNKRVFVRLAKNGDIVDCKVDGKEPDIDNAELRAMIKDLAGL